MLKIKILSFCLLLCLASIMSCKPKNILMSQHFKILGNFSVKFSLVANNFNIPSYREPELELFYQSFLTSAAAASVNISADSIKGLKSIQYVNTHDDITVSGETAAVCVTRAAKSTGFLDQNVVVWKEIQVHKDIKDSYGKEPAKFKAIIYHELAHCLLNIGHYEKEKSIMNSVMDMNDQEFFTNLDTYISKLFNPTFLDNVEKNPSAEQVRTYNWEPSIAAMRHVASSL